MIKNRHINGIGITNFQSIETSRGVAYSAKIWMDEEVVGMLENRGDGGYTHVTLNKRNNEFLQRAIAYLNHIKFDTSDAEEYSVLYTFAEHLIEVHQEGKVSKASIRMGMLV